MVRHAFEHREHAAREVGAGELLPEGDEDLERLFGLSRFVALVVRPEDLVTRRIDDDGLHRRRADIEADDERIEFWRGV